MAPMERRAAVLAFLVPLLAVSCAAPARHPAVPRGADLRVAFGTVGVDVGNPGRETGDGPFVPGNLGFSVGGEGALVALGCCLAYWLVSESMKGAASDGSTALAGGSPLWEEYRRTVSEEFQRGFEEEFGIAAKELAGVPPARPPAEADVLALVELGPARRSGTAYVQLRMRLRVKDRDGTVVFDESMWSDPVPDRVVYDDETGRSFRPAAARIADHLVHTYRLFQSGPRG